MVEGLEVVIKYCGAKYIQVASPAAVSSEFAILKKDLAHLRVHSPSQKNVRRVDGSFILHWPTAGTSPKLDGLADSLHTRWFKLCSDDPEALKLREFLCIESITMTQDGVLIRSTTQRDQALQDPPPGILAGRWSDSSSGTTQKPAQTSAPIHPLPTRPSLPLPPPPRVPPTAPRSERQLAPHLKRRVSGLEGPSGSPTRQKLDMPETQRASPGLWSTNTQAQPNCMPASPKSDLAQRRSITPRDAPKPVREDGVPNQPQPPQMVMPPSHESGEIIEMALPMPLPITTPASGPSTSTLGRGSVSRPPTPVTLSGSAPATASDTAPTPTPMTALATAVSAPIPTSPNPSSASSDTGKVAELMRQLLYTRNALAAVQDQEKEILHQLEGLGAPPVGSYHGGGKGNTKGAEGALRDEVSQLENELKEERTSRLRAERALSEVERECRAPFVVPALFQAFLNISDLSN